MIFLRLLSLLSCAVTSDIRPTAALVTIHELAQRCETPTTCGPVAITLSGTGTRIIWENEYYWLTAGHVCAGGEMMGMKSIMKKITLTVGGTRDIETPRSMTYNISEDLCIVRAKPGPARQIATVEPNLASAVTIVAYPKGVFDHRILPVYDGRWSGNFENKCLVTIPVVGGSSGSGVINSRGQLVGVIEAVATNFNHLTIVSCTENVRWFLHKATEHLKNSEESEIQTQASQSEEN